MAQQRQTLHQAAHTIAAEHLAINHAKTQVELSEETIARQASLADKNYNDKVRELQQLEHNFAVNASHEEAKLKWAQEVHDNRAQLASEELSAAMKASKDRELVQRLQIREEAETEHREALRILGIQQQREASLLRTSLEQEAMSSVKQQVLAMKQAQTRLQADAAQRANDEIDKRDRELHRLRAAAEARDKALRLEQERRGAAEARATRAEADAAQLVNQASSEVARHASSVKAMEAAAAAEADRLLQAATRQAQQDADKLRSADKRPPQKLSLSFAR